MQLSDFLTYVGYDFKRTDKETEKLRAYNDMIGWVAYQIPNSNYKFQSWINTTAGQEDYPLPTNMIHLLHPIRLLLGSGTADSGYELTYIQKEVYDRLEPNPNRTNPTKGRPSSYTVFSRSILFTPIPDLSTYVIEINWSKRVTDLSANTDVPSLGSEWDPVFKQGTLERLYAGIGLTEEANYWGSQYHDQEGNPVGLCRKLLDIEKDIEGWSVNCVKNNAL